eukprot:gene11568-15460_t
MTLSGGMKRRVMIAKALSHEPKILFLDEPSAGVDVELRRDMWLMVRALRDSGVTIILTTHYIEEAEEMADRIGVINKGELVLVEDKDVLMRKLGKKQLTLQLREPLATLPKALAGEALELSADGTQLVFSFDAQAEETGIAGLLRRLGEAGVDFKDLRTEESSLEEIFVNLAIYRFELARWFRTLMQSILAPVISTSLYFVVFGTAIGSRMTAIDGVSYGAFIVPGLIMLAILTESISNASFGIYMPKWSGTIYELLSSPVSWLETVIGYVGAAATKSVLLGLLMLATARLFV